MTPNWETQLWKGPWQPLPQKQSLGLWSALLGGCIYSSNRMFSVVETGDPVRVGLVVQMEKVLVQRKS